LQLTLQGVACKGIYFEGAVAGSGENVHSSMDLMEETDSSSSATMWIQTMVDLLLKQTAAADGATRRAFLAARGGYMLQVMWLVMKMVVEEQQQREQQQLHEQGGGKAGSACTRACVYDVLRSRW
jgi:hypothetical protein